MARPYSPAELQRAVEHQALAANAAEGATEAARHAAASWAANRSKRPAEPAGLPPAGTGMQATSKAKPIGRGTVGFGAAGMPPDGPLLRKKPKGKARPQDHLLNGLQRQI